MPDLTFQVTGTETGARSITPLLFFRLRILNSPPEEHLQAVLLRTQIQIQPARRAYKTAEKERLGEIFGAPERWSHTLRNKLWAQLDINVPAFTRETEVLLPVPCTFDLNVLASKYFQALDEGEVSLLFLFSGSVFYAETGDRIQVQQIPWEKECTYSIPVRVWHGLMEHFFPGSAWISLHRDMFERLAAYKRQHGLPTWDKVIERLLALELNEGVRL